jgi:hypothetical protein
MRYFESLESQGIIWTDEELRGLHRDFVRIGEFSGSYKGYLAGEIERGALREISAEEGEKRWKA